ncbi:MULTISPECIES: helix-turn-helix transcriptional regulator [Breznakia]|uniref:Putative transcriptional regulator n=1 Tax=Breznakia blatticola TaxID=1754012 RepID=A0A4R7ZA48_9FIRM|nr:MULTISPECIES: helix-turn-helix transcriptional regulator [Breznakia]MDH6368021.1 putative transcriptional regulator [Breznakia sp. PH1-1]MDH6405093.1 putative transcriptional regulator [Breznakia sp. PF1-11]MDH6412824.1 putative transcriptional regulator [Breznakia sp. PFB1-11]MDH6415184.1 putative transcriptional regulator [Breznakia sp. PFB1-14]MDH6417495.1 putative transcriptional regulator [Breznakia sp. PFB1-4]
MEELQLQNRLSQKRSELKLSQQALADLVGVSRNTISSIETLQYTPSAKLALLIAIALHCTFEDIFYFE